MLLCGVTKSMPHHKRSPIITNYPCSASAQPELKGSFKAYPLILKQHAYQACISHS